MPFGSEDVLHDLVERLVSLRRGSFLAVLKRMGESSPGLLSFPMAGWTIAVDLANDPTLCRALDELDCLVASAKGRIYLAKDSRARFDVINRMYPELDAFRRVKQELDPQGVFQSDLSRRLRLAGPRGVL